MKVQLRNHHVTKTGHYYKKGIAVFPDSHPKVELPVGTAILDDADFPKEIIEKVGDVVKPVAVENYKTVEERQAEIEEAQLKAQEEAEAAAKAAEDAAKTKQK